MITVKILLLSTLIVLFFTGVSANQGELAVSGHVLGNGLKILVLEKHTAPVACVQVWYRAGNYREWEGVRGVTHLLEHMMFRGSENYGSNEHSRLINEVGGDSNAFTTEDVTVFHTRLPSGELELAFTLEADRMHLLKLNREMLDIEREVVKEEYRLNYENDPVGEAYMKARRILYPNHPYSWVSVGVLEDIERITVGDCRAFYDRFYGPNNAVVVVAGDVTTENVVDMAELHFGSIPPRAVPVLDGPDLSLPSYKGFKRYREKIRLPVSATAVAFHIPASSHPDIIPLKVLANILLKGKGSRLTGALMRDKELAVETFGYIDVLQGPGLMAFVGVHYPTVSSHRVERAILEMIDTLKTEEVSQRELQKAYKQLLADRIYDGYSVEGLAHSLGFAEMVRGDHRLFATELQEFRAVTTSDILRVANRYFYEDSTTVIHFQPERINPLVWIHGIFSSLF
jgi:zinc protease